MKSNSANSLESLESRVHLSTTPSSVLNKAARQTLLSHLSTSINSALQADLNANNLSTFDTRLLNYSKVQTKHFFFDPKDVANIVSYINSNSHYIHTSDIFKSADAAVADGPDASSDRQTEWISLAEAYRLGGNTKYSTELVNSIAAFSKANPALSDWNTWRDHSNWQRLDTSLQSENWTWTYELMVGSTAWTKEANTVFLEKMYEHGDELNTIEPMALTSNQSAIQAQGLLYISEIFPGFKNASTWQKNARTLLFKSMDTQFYNDGSDDEQSPEYAATVVNRLLEARLLDQRNGIVWASERVAKLSRAVDALFQTVSPNGETPAIGDTYRTDLSYMWLKSDLIQKRTTWPSARPRARDAFLLTPTAVNPYLNNAAEPTLGTRGKTKTLKDSGNYIFRSGDDANARQINFDAGPRGYGHGHYDLFNFELSGYGKPLISDPGPYLYDTSAARTWAISTPAHNTISLDGKNVDALEGSTNSSIKVDQYTIGSNSVQITAHHLGYKSLKGSPVVSRSLWYDYDGTILIVDWVNASASHTIKQSFLLPGTSNTRDLAKGLIQSTNSTGGNVRIQSLLQGNQTAALKQTGVFTSSNTTKPADPATQFYVSQSGSFACFVTLINAYNGTTAPAISAKLLTKPGIGRTISVALTKSGATQNVTFTPPAAASAKASSAATQSVRSAAPASQNNDAVHTSNYASTNFSTNSLKTDFEIL